MTAPYKVKSFYQVRTYIGFDIEETNAIYSFTSYNKAKEWFETETKRADNKYTVELLSVVEVQETKDKSGTKSQYLVLGDNL